MGSKYVGVLTSTVALATVLAGSPFFSASAAELGGSPSSAAVTDLSGFAGLDDNASILILPDGSYIHGHATVADIGAPDKVFVTYDSETDSHATTVGAIKAGTNDADSQYYVLHQLNNGVSTGGITILAATPPAASKVTTLDAGDVVRSNAFSASGWRFGETLYKSKDNTGPYLKWHSMLDSGVVGSCQQALNTNATGTVYGTSIAKNSYAYVSGTNVYYTYNPVNGSYYIVENN